MKLKVDQLLEKFNGNISWKQINDARISPTTIYRMVESGELEQAYRGLFVGASDFEDTEFLIQQRFQKGIISYDSALAIHGLSNIMPEKIHVSFPQGYHLKKKVLEELPIMPHYVKEEYYVLGIATAESAMGNQLRVYNKERTLCDIWNPWSRITEEYRFEAVKEYMESKDRDIPKLLDYMDKLPIKRSLQDYIQILV